MSPAPAPIAAPVRPPVVQAAPPRRKRLRAWVTLVVVLLIAGSAGAGVYRMRRAQSSDDVPVMQVKQGEFLVVVRCRGALDARHSTQFYTPMAPGLRIAWMAPPGEPVKQGDSFIRFYSSQAKQQLAKK
jgi:HlyD family secretion protein